MPLTVKVAGAWKHTRAGVRISGAWKDVPQVYVNVGGTWKALYSFAWETGNWSACSAECGGGTQTRTVRCRRSDGQYYDDAVCGRFAGEKPATSEACNTQECTECRYNVNLDKLSGSDWVWSWKQEGIETSMFIWDGVEIAYESFETTETYVNGYRYYKGTLQETNSSKWHYAELYQICRSPA